MYLPLQFMEQIEHMVTVTGHSELNEIANKRQLEFFGQLIEKDRSTSLMGWSYAWNQCRYGVADKHCRELYKSFAADYVDYVGFKAEEATDFFHTSLLSIIHHDWSRSKRVYKIEPEMLHDLCTMNTPKQIPVKVLAQLPSKCFYIDFGGPSPYTDNSEGLFVTCDFTEGYFTCLMTTIVKNKRLVPVHSLTIIYTDEEVSETFIDRYQEKVHLPVEGGSIVNVNEKLLMRFFYNFCMYLNAANSDVEYTERTRQIYKPSTASAPKNKLREIEEFGVGYRYASTIGEGKVRVKYVGGNKPEKDPNAEKRGYSSNYRCAHWHQYWVNDPDHPGEKKLITKWIKETFVRGNKGPHNDAIVHRVVKGKNK